MIDITFQDGLYLYYAISFKLFTLLKLGEYCPVFACDLLAYLYVSNLMGTDMSSFPVFCLKFMGCQTHVVGT